jgi:hypothetical protein
MTPDSCFSLFNLLALVGWILLAAGVVFRLAWLADAVAGRLIPFVLGVLYVVLIVKFWATAEGGFSSLQGVKSLFQSDWLLLAGWVHYLAFDLFVGAWIARTAVESRLSRLVLVPILPLTFLFGPAGFVAFELTRRIAVLPWRTHATKEN